MLFLVIFTNPYILLSLLNPFYMAVMRTYSQETAAHPCDTGSPRDLLEKEFKQDWMDFSNCFDGWNKKTGEQNLLNMLCDYVSHAFFR